MNLLAASVLAAGELVCEFHDGYRPGVVADLAAEQPRGRQMRFYGSLAADAAHVISTTAQGRKAVQVRATDKAVYLVQPEGPSVRVTALTGCLDTGWRRGKQTCLRFAARHAWHFDHKAALDPDASFERIASTASPGICEPWKID